MIRKVITYLGLALFCQGCNVGDVGSSEQQSSTVDDDSVQNGTTECTTECEPVDGGFIFSQVCNGNIVDGPEFAAVQPSGCVVLDEEEPEEEGFFG